MPASGGTADKLGNRYEALWAIDQLLRVVSGEFVELVLEPPDPDESRGIEFRTLALDGVKAHWSCKRQMSGLSGWTIAKLVEKGVSDRSILGDLIGHVAGNPTHVAVFASIQDATDLRELIKHADDDVAFRQRLAQNDRLQAEFKSRILPLFANDTVSARKVLNRLRVRTADEDLLRITLDNLIAALFCRKDRAPLDAAALRGVLGELLLDNLGRAVTRDAVLEHLNGKGYGLADWHADQSILDRLNVLNRQYMDPVLAQRIDQQTIPIPGIDLVVDSAGSPTHWRAIATGSAGVGKSVVLAEVARRAIDGDVPVLALRFDTLTEGLTTSQELGRKYGLPASPVAVLANIAKGRTALLVIDQLDAVSTASGRNTTLWEQFDTLEREARSHSNLNLIVGCRQFDLDHDFRMRRLARKDSDFVQIKLTGLTKDQVREVLQGHEIVVTSLPPALVDFLCHPLHLAMYLELEPERRPGVTGEASLLGEFWKQKEQRVQARIGLPTGWAPVIDAIVDWLNENQSLALPKAVVAGHGGLGNALVSEGVLVDAGADQYRFAHETLFDFAFATRFIARGRNLHQFIVEGEQGLFRRAQVRQLLVHLRRESWDEYLRDLEALLLDPGIRFHLKRVILQFLGAVPDPTSPELATLWKLAEGDADGRRFANGTTFDHPGWFDVLDKEGHFDQAFRSGDRRRIESAIGMMGANKVMGRRSTRVAEILRAHFQSSELWRQWLSWILTSGAYYHSDEFYEFFVERIRDGTLDRFRPGLAVNDGWWDLLHACTTDNPRRACEVIGERLDRMMVLHPPESGAQALKEALEQYDGNGAYHFQECAKRDPGAFVESVLPRLVRMIEATLGEPSTDSLARDEFFSFRMFGEGGFDDLDALWRIVEGTMKSLAVTDAPILDEITGRIERTESDSLTFLVLRAWTAAPKTYGERLAEYLGEDPRRLKVGYQMSGGGGDVRLLASREAVRGSSAHCTEDGLRKLEEAILRLTDDYERNHPKELGSTQLELLTGLDPQRMGSAAKARLEELRTRFGRQGGEPPEESRIRRVRSPIPDSAPPKMTNEHWLAALKKYAGVDSRAPGRSTGGRRQVAEQLRQETEKNPLRFVRFGAALPLDLPPTYLGAVLRGVAEHRRSNPQAVTEELRQAVADLIRRAHAVDSKGCGRDICWLLFNWPSEVWEQDIVEIAAWYAEHDPDPSEPESWTKRAGSGESFRGGDPYQAGINTVRGAAADAIATLLESDPGRFPTLKHAIGRLALDPSVAVRTVALSPVGVVLNISSGDSISWFLKMVSSDYHVLHSPHFEQYLHAAVVNHYRKVRPVLQRMLRGADTAGWKGFVARVADFVVKRARKRTAEAFGSQGNGDDGRDERRSPVAVAARQTCLAAFATSAAVKDAAKVRSGSDVMRKAATGVYAANIADSVVGKECQERLLALFEDEDKTVRIEAARAFDHFGELPIADQGALLDAFLSSNPPGPALFEPLRALHEIDFRLPGQAFALLERWIEIAGSGQGGTTMAAVSDIWVVDLALRLLKQSDTDPVLRGRSLDLIDAMERMALHRLGSELAKLER